VGENRRPALAGGQQAHRFVAARGAVCDIFERYQVIGVQSHHRQPYCLQLGHGIDHRVTKHLSRLVDGCRQAGLPTASPGAIH
jgi:hypothetical protein